MIVNVHLKETAQPITHENVVNTYTKGDLYCVYELPSANSEGSVFKYPIASIWRVKETYR